MACIVVGMSGGVDSAVAALLLQRAGHDVHGVFMQNWSSDDPHCSIHTDSKDVRAICKHLDIPFTMVNFERAYWDKVFRYFLDGYTQGYTPNPDVLCNKEIKFKAFLDYAQQQGADYIATGHYVRSAQKSEGWHLYCGVDPRKDQSYFLHQLNQVQLAHSLFPLGGMTKQEVRHLARQAGLPNCDKKDSVGICFIEPGRFRDFLASYVLAQPGPIETLDGQVIGKHRGVMFYTLGQREGLGLGGRCGADSKPWYVARKDPERRALIVVQGSDHPALFSTCMRCEGLHWIAGHPPGDAWVGQVRIRYHQPAQTCYVDTGDRGICRITFKEPQRAATPGQFAVFYQDDECLGGAVVASVIR